ncbi:hypothetical protein F8568_014200 [Actinomadura sp. LD22]|uniref:Htaa domain protein n=1 Tax=Actinomadura physcomitrii TaxID=2650748 RepID=A0A6I4M9B7_9ACTN|nr:hypothetical protein [Actinomadura physcomitrii]MWA01510.1 hypothetical protein [Actinomadura physcomitrii]
MSRPGKAAKASLAAITLAASALVPSVARADATDVTVTTTFDRLDPARVATFEVTVKSASGVTDVRANVRYASSTAEPYATIPFTRTAGTDNDGVWHAEFHPDIQARPGANGVEVLVTTADGATTKRNTGFVDCYTTTIQGFTSAPAVIDADHPDVTLHGRVMLQKSRDVEPEPAPSARVVGAGPDVTTGADGSFVQQASGEAAPRSEVPRQGALCGVTVHAGTTVRKQATVTTGQIVSIKPYADRADVVVRGRVVRQGAAGAVPVPGQKVSAVLDAGTPGAASLTSDATAADGTFELRFTASRSGALSVATGDTAFLTGGSADLGRLQVRRTTRFDNLRILPQTVGYDALLYAYGYLRDYSSVSLPDRPVLLEFSTDKKTWKQASTVRTEDNGAIYLSDASLKKDGYWRVRFAGGPKYAPVVSAPQYVDVRYRTWIYSFNASPEPVKKGKTITVKGQLFRYMDKQMPGPNAPVSLYFQAKGSSKWTQVATVKTASNGWFSKTFKASQDGTWRASYNGSAAYLASNKPTDYVDVQ